MIIVFDLDDTLYQEIEYVKSGFRAVSEKLYKKYFIDKNCSFNFMFNYLKKNGRGNIFNALLIKYNIFTKRNLKECINCYRLHNPSISIDNKTINILLELKKEHSLYLVTDGNKLVQKKKIDALKINRLFKKIFITHRYGLKNAKPSLYCFNKIKILENCEWSNIIYIGDNPKKDFVNLNKVGAMTIRVLQGSYKKMEARKSYDAKLKFNSLNDFFINNELKKTILIKK